MMNQMEKKLLNTNTLTSVEQRLFHDLVEACVQMTKDLSYSPSRLKTFMELYPQLSREQQSWLKASYASSRQSLLMVALHANIGQKNEIAAQALDFLLSQGFFFNKADLQYFKKNNGFAFKKIVYDFHIYEATWYSPLNKWAQQIKEAFLKLIGKDERGLYVIQYPNHVVKPILMKHYECLPQEVKSLVLTNANQNEMTTLLQKENAINKDEFNFFTKSKQSYM